MPRLARSRLLDRTRPIYHPACSQKIARKSAPVTTGLKPRRSPQLEEMLQREEVMLQQELQTPYKPPARVFETFIPSEPHWIPIPPGPWPNGQHYPKEFIWRTPKEFVFPPMILEFFPEEKWAWAREECQRESRMIRALNEEMARQRAEHQRRRNELLNPTDESDLE